MAVRDAGRLSRTISHALRHEPGAYGLELDAGGWADLDELVRGLRRHRREWRGLGASDVEAMIRRSEKRRFEIRDGRIRALYGHSLDRRIEKEPARPPEILHHGTTPAAAEAILREGLEPRGRQYVHLSPDRETARAVGRRRTDDPVILAVRARQAREAGVRFYRGGPTVWLSDPVDPRFIDGPGEAQS